MTERNEREQAGGRRRRRRRRNDFPSFPSSLRARADGGESMAHNSLFRDRFPPPRSPPGIIRPPLIPFLSVGLPFFLARAPNLDQWRRLGEAARGLATEHGSSARSRPSTQKPPFFPRNSKFGRGWIILHPRAPVSSPPPFQLRVVPASRLRIVRTIVAAYSAGCWSRSFCSARGNRGIHEHDVGEWGRRGEGAEEER